MAWLYFHYLFYFVAASIRISEGSKIEKSCQGKDQASSVCNVHTNDLTASNRQGRQGIHCVTTTLLNRACQHPNYPLIYGKFPIMLIHIQHSINFGLAVKHAVKSTASLLVYIGK